MTKIRRRLLWLSFVPVAAVGIVLLVPASRWWVLGTWRGEPFQDGRPLSYWMMQLEEGAGEDKIRAVQALDKMGRHAVPAVPALARLLVDRDFITSTFRDARAKEDRQLVASVQREIRAIDPD